MWILNGKLTSHGEGKYWILTIWNYSVMKLYELITGLMKMTLQIWHRRFILPLVLETIRLKMKAISLLNSDGKVTSCVHIAALQAIDRKGSISGLLLLIITFFFLHADSLVFVLFVHTSQIIHPKA